jgi:hypothetical protein
MRVESLLRCRGDRTKLASLAIFSLSFIGYSSALANEGSVPTSFVSTAIHRRHICRCLLFPACASVQKRRMIFTRVEKWYSSRLPLLVSLPGAGGRNVVVRGFFDQLASVSQSWVGQTRGPAPCFQVLPTSFSRKTVKRPRTSVTIGQTVFIPECSLQFSTIPSNPQIHVALCESFYDIAY